MTDKNFDLHSFSVYIKQRVLCLKRYDTGRKSRSSSRLSLMFAKLLRRKSSPENGDLIRTSRFSRFRILVVSERGHI
jgi:hypothetical protein